MAVVAEDCDQPDIRKLVEALCNEYGVQLLSVPESKQLGQWAGVRAELSTLPIPWLFFSFTIPLGVGPALLHLYALSVVNCRLGSISNYFCGHVSLCHSSG